MKALVPSSQVEVAEVTGQDEGLRKRFLDLLEARPDEVPETAQPPEQGAAPETPEVAHTGVANALVPVEIVRGVPPNALGNGTSYHTLLLWPAEDPKWAYAVDPPRPDSRTPLL